MNTRKTEFMETVRINLPVPILNALGIPEFRTK